MKRILLVLICVAVSVPGFANLQKKKKKNAEPEVVKLTLETANDSISYAMGIFMAQSLIDDSAPDFIKEADIDIMNHALADAVKGEDQLMDIDQVMEFLDKVFREYAALEQEKKEEEGRKIRQEAEKFLEENAAKEGVIITESGLQYKVEKEGEGEKPSLGSVVKVKYELSLSDGTVLETTDDIEDGEGVEIPLGYVIRGWQEGVQLMSPGAVYYLYVPYDLAYGDMGQGNIPPYSTLVFKIELVSFEDSPYGSMDGMGDWEYYEETYESWGDDVIDLEVSEEEEAPVVMELIEGPIIEEDVLIGSDGVVR